MDRHIGNSNNCNAESKSANQTGAEKCPSVSVVTSIHKSTVIASIRDTKVECLLDSGAQLSCISKSFFSITNLQGSKLQPSDMPKIAGVGGESHRILGILEAPIKISKAHFQCKLYVLHDLQHPVILGIDFLDSHKVGIDFGKKLGRGSFGNC